MTKKAKATATLPAALQERNAQVSRHAASGQKLAAARPSNADKALEYGACPLHGARPVGEHVDAARADLAGTLSETQPGDKTGADAPRDAPGKLPPGSLAHARVAPGVEPMTTRWVDLSSFDR